MSSAEPFSSYWSFSEATLGRVQALLHAIAADVLASQVHDRSDTAPEAWSSILITERELMTENVAIFLPESGGSTAVFTLLLSEPFCVLLRGQNDGLTSTYQVDLTFDREAIAQFSQMLISHVRCSDALALCCASVLKTKVENDAAYQRHFTLRLIEAMTASTSPGGEVAKPLTAPAQAPQPSMQVDPEIIQGMQQQIQQERLISQVTGQIRQSLDLRVILQTAVEQGCRLLNVDRLVIYQLGQSSPVTDTAPSKTRAGRTGVIIHEARRSEAISSVLNTGKDLCFDQLLTYQNKYLQETMLAVSNIEVQYEKHACLLHFLRKAEVKAKLVVPIWVQESLWGFIIAHDCTQPRIWQADAPTFLKHIAEHLAIAISQAQLYEQLHQQTQTLEQRVIERTQELQDAMLASQLANRAKGEFLSAVSHELRTPLTCIIGMSATLQRWTEDVLDERQKNFLQIIHDSGETLLELINNILDLSKLEAGKAILNLSDFSITLLAQQTLESFQERADHQTIRLMLDLQIAPGCDRCVADQGRMRQVLSNLLSNAIKFTNPGGQVTLRIAAETTMTIIQVVDTGIGIPAQKLSLLFQKFQQLDASYQRNYSGVGLGLALIKQIVELHGGWIEVDSTVEVGSTFTVYFPQKASDLAIAAPKAAPLADKTAGRVVLIESHEDSASIICDVLNAADYQMIWMIDSSMAIAQAEILQPQIVIINRELADSDGYDIIRSLRQNVMTCHLKILAILPTDDPESQHYSLSAGADDWLTNPIVPEEVLVKVNALMADIKPQISDNHSLV